MSDDYPTSGMFLTGRAIFYYKSYTFNYYKKFIVIIFYDHYYSLIEL